MTEKIEVKGPHQLEIGFASSAAHEVRLVKVAGVSLNVVDARMHAH